MKANERDVMAALDRGGAGVRLFVLHGADEASSAALAGQLGKALGPDAERIDLDGAALKHDPGRLPDEAAALGLFSGARWVRVQGGDECLAAVEALLGLTGHTAPVVLVAGSFRANSLLLKLALERRDVMALQSYKLEGERLDTLVRLTAREHGLKLDGPLVRRLAEATTGDRALLARECEKYALYLDAAPDRPRDVTADLMDLLEADAAEGSAFAVVDAAFDGEPGRLADAITALPDPDNLVPVLRLASRRALMLAGLRSKVEGGRAPGQVMASDARWLKGREQDAVGRQLNRWTASRLATAQHKLFEAEEQLKVGPAGALHAAHALLTIARAGAR